MSNGHFCLSNAEWTFECPMDISVRPKDERTYEWPMDISVRPMDICVGPMDEWTFIYVQWTCDVYNAKQAAMT